MKETKKLTVQSCAGRSHDLDFTTSVDANKGGHLPAIINARVQKKNWTSRFSLHYNISGLDHTATANTILSSVMFIISFKLNIAAEHQEKMLVKLKARTVFQKVFAVKVRITVDFSKSYLNNSIV